MKSGEGTGRDGEPPVGAPGDAALAAVGRLDGTERLAVLGAIVAAAGLFLPWFGVQVGSGLVLTGWSVFGATEAALVLTLAAAVCLVVLRSRGRARSLPFREGTLLAGAGAWASGLVLFRIAAERPEITRGGIENAYGLRYGVFVVLAGTLTVLLAGLRRRRAHRR